MPVTNVNGVEIAYETHGDPSNPALMLVMGLGSQLVHWPDELVDGLVERGLFVVRHDNRDVGLSQKFTDFGVPDLGAIATALASGEKPDAPYFVSDMAADAMGVLDDLGIERAHIMGVSMGGMIVQNMAGEYPDRIKSVVPIMTSSGEPGLDPATPEAMGALMAPAKSDKLEDVLENNNMIREAIGSPGFPSDPARNELYATRAYERCYHPEGTARQMAAVVASGGRADVLKNVTAPMLIIHGTDDPLVPISGGRDIAKHVPHAEMVEIEGYGHDLPLQLMPRFVEMIADFAHMVEGKQAAAE